MTIATHVHQRCCRQLLLDCDDPIFEGPVFGSLRNKQHLESDESEDAITWSAFRLLDRHFGNLPWLDGLLREAGCAVEVHGKPSISFWVTADPPQSRLLWLLDHVHDRRITQSDGARKYPARLADLQAHVDFYRQRVREGKVHGRARWVLERASHIDAVFRTSRLIVAVEAKYHSPLEVGSTWDTGRDQIARVVDAGLALAQENQDFVFLLVTDARVHRPPKNYESLMQQYRSDSSFPIAGDHLGWLIWGEIYRWLERQRPHCTPVQVEWIERLRAYLGARQLLSVD